MRRGEDKEEIMKPLNIFLDAICVVTARVLKDGDATDVMQCVLAKCIGLADGVVCRVLNALPFC
ncbi:Elongation factor EF-2 [Corchorus olitorius]|uniref:Elongation factor EF-2 n=1 Tax=Corchorus olitorius TaxID=93759 RepID=A0A1R3KEY8_9ROSI|nr:Elongation factor EF-2 [Corchorus olitorius]